MHLLGALVRSQAAERSFSRARARKKKSRPITTIHRGAAREPPRSRQGAHFWIQWPQGCSRKRRKNKKNSPGHGTRDDDRISHALGTRPGEFIASRADGAVHRVAPRRCMCRPCRVSHTTKDCIGFPYHCSCLSNPLRKALYLSLSF